MANESDKIEMVILYLIKKLGNRLTRTKLMKLLFISDYLAKHGKKLGLGKTITGTRYVYYHHGPFSFDVYPAIGKMDGFEIIEFDLSGESRYGSLYSYGIGPNPRFNVKLKVEERRILDFVIRKYGYLDLDRILSIVYNSKPMKNKNVNDVILE